MWKMITWQAARNDPSVRAFEHPILNATVVKDVFADEFCAVLDELDGRSMADHIDFFFERDRLDLGILRFRGNDEKEDFFDFAVECGCCPPLDDIHAGEDSNSGRGSPQATTEKTANIVSERAAARNGDGTPAGGSGDI